MNSVLGGAMERHLVVDLSGHGYGHAAITCPVLNALRRRCPGLRVTIRSTVPAGWLAQRLDGPFDHLVEPDFGMVMKGAMRVLPEDSLAAYKCLHKEWRESVSAAAARLATHKPTLLLSNISYLSLAAARQAGIPAIAFSAVNWADVFRAYCIELPGARPIWEQMVEAYAAADVFFQPVPAMPMPSIYNRRLVGPIAVVGRNRHHELCDRLNLGPGVALILIALGGIPTCLPCGSWPRLAGAHPFVASAWASSHPDVTPCEMMNFPFVDLVRSCDAVITKPGYGLVAEAACNGTPVLLLPRPGWPETRTFISWLQQHGRVHPIPEEKLLCGEFLQAIHAVRALPAPPVPKPTGIAQIADELAERIDQRPPLL